MSDCNLTVDVVQIKRNTEVLTEIVEAKNLCVAYQTADGEWKRLRVLTKAHVETLRHLAAVVIDIRPAWLIPRVVDSVIDTVLNVLVDELNT